jgi:hypothetical protein
MFGALSKRRKPAARLGIAVVSAPKTASTFVKHVLCRILDLDPIDILRRDVATQRGLSEEADLALAPQIRRMSKPAIAHVHLLPNPNTLLFLERAALRPVIVWRPIEDCVVSLREEWERQWSSDFKQIAADGHSQQFLGIVPWAFVCTFLQASEEERHDLVIDLAVPWYCRFISGWRGVEESRKVPMASICYEVLAHDEVSAIQNLLRQLGLSVSEGVVGENIARVKANRIAANTSIGRPGRGHALLTDRQKTRIRQIMVPFGVADSGREAPVAPVRIPQDARATAIQLATRALWNADNDLRVGHTDSAVAGYGRVLELLDQDSAAEAENLDNLQCRFQAFYALAKTYERLPGKATERQVALRSALEVLERLSALNPVDLALPTLAARISLAANPAAVETAGVDGTLRKASSRLPRDGGKSARGPVRRDQLGP